MIKTVDQYISKKEHWSDALQKLRQLCLETGMKEEVKWGAPIYTLDGKNIVGFVGFKSYVGLWFHQGVYLEDKHHLLEQSSETTKGLRKMMFQSLDEINKKESIIKAYISEAIVNHKAGKEIKINRSAKLDLPVELEVVLANNDQLRKAFDNISPGKQREFAEYISSAKQLATKERRISKISKMILEGVGLHDRYK